MLSSYRNSERATERVPGLLWGWKMAQTAPKCQFWVDEGQIMHHLWYWRYCQNIFQGHVHYWGRPINDLRSRDKDLARWGHSAAVLGSQTGSKAIFRWKIIKSRFERYMIHKWCICLVKFLLSEMLLLHLRATHKRQFKEATTDMIELQYSPLGHL